jgi:hypothetical protein
MNQNFVAPYTTYMDAGRFAASGNAATQLKEKSCNMDSVLLQRGCMVFCRIHRITDAANETIATASAAA